MQGSRLEQDGEDDHSVEEVSTDVSPQKISNQLSSRKNKQKQRKKKKSKPEAAEAEATPQQQEDKAEEDIDKILQELNIKVIYHAFNVKSTAKAIYRGECSGLAAVGLSTINSVSLQTTN